MITANLKLREYTATPTWITLGTAMSYGVEQIELDLDDTWQSVQIRATFHADDKAVAVVPDGVVITVPSEATAKPLSDGIIVIDGVRDGQHIYSTNVGFRVIDHATAGGSDTEPPTPTEMEQILALYKTASDSAKSAEESARNAAEAADRARPYAEDAAHSAVIARSAAEIAESAKTEAVKVLADVTTAGTDAVADIRIATNDAIRHIDSAEDIAVGNVARSAADAMGAITAAGGQAVADAENAAADARVQAGLADTASKSASVSASNAQESATSAGTSATAAQTAENNAVAIEQRITADYGTLPDQVSTLNNYILPRDVYTGSLQLPASTTVYIDSFDFLEGETYTIEYVTPKSVTIGAYPGSKGGSILLRNTEKMAEFTPNATGKPFLYASSPTDIALAISMKKPVSLVDDFAIVQADIDGITDDIAALNAQLKAEDVIGSGTFECQRNVTTPLGFNLAAGETYTVRYSTTASCLFFANTAGTGGYITLAGSGVVEYTPKVSGVCGVYFTAANGMITVEAVIPHPESIPARLDKVEDEILQIRPKEYTVGTGGDFQTLTAAFTALAADTAWKTLRVAGGTYDIYEELGGREWLNSLDPAKEWHENSLFVPLNTRIIGDGMVTLLFNIPNDANSTIAGYISCLNVAGSVEMENIRIICDNCRYGIHDEYVARFGTNAGTRHIYRNVQIDKKRTATGSSMAFGSGHNENEQFLFENCVFVHSNTGSSQGLLMHNRYANDHTVVIIRDSVMRGYYAGVKFGNVPNGESHISITISNSVIDGTLHDVICEKQSATSPATSNAYDVTMIRCGDATLENTIGAGYNGTIYGGMHD